MILYHGSNVRVEIPKIIENKRAVDFGHGFYLTSDHEQAKKWAIISTKRRMQGIPTISIFDFNEKAFEKLNVLKFDDGPTNQWLDYVCLNRKNKNYTDNYDIVIGPVANDQTARTINDYLDKFISKEETIRQLLPQKLKDQYAFKTKEALKYIKFREAEKYE